MSLFEITSAIETAQTQAGRAPNSVCLIAVSKKQPIQRVINVLQQGQRVFGENHVQEAYAKWPPLRETWPDIDLHFLGALQTNKVRRACALFSTIHSLDRIDLAKKIATVAQNIGRCPALFIQVNTGHEPQKSGIAPQQVHGFVAQCRALDLPVVGLMVIPPVANAPAPHFTALAHLAAENGLSGLSMGMSSDFPTAIACGATHVRVGSALFGVRPNASVAVQ